MGFINIHSFAKYQKTRRGDSFETLKIFQKISHSVKKLSKADHLLSSDFLGYVKKEKKIGGPFALSFRWPDLA